MALVDRMNHEVRQLKPSDILQFNAEISGIKGIVKLTLGEPDFPTPEHVKAAGIQSIENDESHYTQSKGLPGLRAPQAIIWQRNIKPLMIRRRRF